VFYTTDKLSATEVETAVLHSGMLSSVFVTSMQASLLAKNSSVSMDLMSNNTAVTVDDTTAASTEDASTTPAILTTAFDSATSNTASVDSLIIHSSIATTPLFYATDKLSATEAETAQLQSGIITSNFVTSVAASSFAENVILS
jgi:2-hydroxy-3-keto-5-methylthiopentenyl-1-phosphate phosphatase